MLKSLDVPLEPFGEATTEALNELTRRGSPEALHLGMVIPMTYDAGNGEQTDWTPVWTLKSTYTLGSAFPGRQDGRGGALLCAERRRHGCNDVPAPPADATDEDRPKEYKAKYCTDDDLIKTIKKSLKDPEDLYSAPYYESWISYIWSTGANWTGRSASST